MSLLRTLTALWVVALFLLSGCAKKAMAPEPMAEVGAYGGMEEMDDYGGVADMEVAAISRSAPRRSKRAPAAPPPPVASPAPAGRAPVPEAAPATPAKPARMVHYSGWTRVRVAKVEEAADAVVALARAVDGEVERVGGRVVTIRVPVARFQEVFARLTAELGDVLDKSISAEDVTEAFQSMDLRLGTARKTRDRLVELLARSENEQEKLALVREIQRVSEEIDRMEAQLRTLSRLASMSRITVELEPRAAQAWTGQQEPTAELAWLRALSPFRPDIVSREGDKLVLDVPAGMVQLTPKARFIAESADGARIWSGRLPNEPVGDAAFWIGALQTRLAGDFASAEVRQLGGFTVLTLVDRADSPYTWVIAIRDVGRKLHVVEAYFPTPEQTARHQAAVEAVLLAAGGAA